MLTSKLLQHKSFNYKSGNVLFYVVVLVVVLLYLTFQPALMTFEQAQSMAGAYDYRAAVYLFSFAIMLLCALTPLPAELIVLANTFIYSPVEAFLVTWLSAVLSAYVGYEFGRLNGLDPCNYKDSGKICRWLKVYGYKALAIMRLIPVVPFFALNICGGIFKLDRCKYTLITAITILPAVLLLTFFPHLFI
ncbi:MAG: VTT domain-containing protein [Gammaproteobacteria bacterium]